VNQFQKSEELRRRSSEIKFRLNECFGDLAINPGASSDGKHPFRDSPCPVARPLILGKPLFRGTFSIIQIAG
jgi:hypothetical protein